MLKLSAGLAMGAGAVLAVAQLVRNWGNWERWPTWTIDEFAAAVMILAGVLALRKRTTRLLPVGWAFACGLYTSSFVSHLAEIPRLPESLQAAGERLTMVIGAVLGLTLVGLALVLFAPRKRA